MMRPGDWAEFILGFVLVCLSPHRCALAQSSGEFNHTGEFNRAMEEFRAGEYASTAVLFAQVEAASPGETDAALYRVKALVHLQDFSGAERSLRSYLARHASSSDALYLLGFVLNRESRAADSLAVYTQAAAIARPGSDDLKIVGLDYVLLNDYADAIRWLEKSVEFNPANKDAWYYLGRADYTKGRLEDARKAFLKVLALDPHDARAENNLGLIFESNGQPDAAMDAYRTAIAWQEQNPHPGDNDPAKDREKDKDQEQPYVNLGNLLVEQGRAQEALAPLEKAVALAPGNAYCHMTLGVYYRKAGQMDSARRELERATELDPDNAATHYQLGRLYKDIHALDLAKAEFDRTEEIKSRNARAR
jgi:tetratricopeptide (TPR) repeat protein